MGSRQVGSEVSGAYLMLPFDRGQGLGTIHVLNSTSTRHDSESGSGLTNALQIHLVGGLGCQMRTINGTGTGNIQETIRARCLHRECFNRSTRTAASA